MDQATVLLAQQIARIDPDLEAGRATLRKAFIDADHSLRELIETRLDAMDKANVLLAQDVRQFPSDLDKATKALQTILTGEIRNVQDVANEKFTAIEGTFASNALALTAALAAQKEAASEQNKSNTLAITKSEQATKETISANAAQTTAGLASQAATIDDIKQRVVRIESMGVGATGQRTAAAEGLNSRLLAIGVAISLVVIVVNVIFFALQHH
jgi:hypothetical protein